MGSTLKLIIEKGPRNGETLEFNSSSTIKLGRVVRGNNLPIKDPGISSKHLTIGFISDSGKWVITDLGSSNGTILNSTQLVPLSPFEISDGDEIKVGELTSIRVEIVEIGEEFDFRRKTRAGKIGRDLGENEEVGFVEDVEGKVVVERENKKGRGRGRGRGGAKRGGVMEEGKCENEGNLGSVSVKLGGGVSTRRTRGSRREEEELISLEMVMPVRRTRRAKVVEEVAVEVEEKKDDCRDVDDGSVAENTRIESMKVVVKVEEVEGLEEVDGAYRKEVENVGVVDNKRRGGGRGRKKKVGAKVGQDRVGGVLEGGASKDLPEMEGPEQVELREELCKEVGDVTVDCQQNVMDEKAKEGRASTDLSEMENPDQVELREELCKEVRDVTVDCQQNNMDEKAKEGVLEVELPEPVQGTLFTEEQPGARPTKVILEHSELEDRIEDSLRGEVPEEVSGSLCANEQCLQPLIEVTELIEPIDEDHENSLEKVAPEHDGGSPDACSTGEQLVRNSLYAGEQPCAEPIDDTEQDEEAVGVSEVEEGTFNGKSAEALKDTVMGENEIDEISNTEQDEEAVGVSQVEEGTSNGKSAEALKDTEMGEREIDEISKECGTSSTGIETDQEAPDLEKMTLGEWFDYLEVYLSKQIYTATDEVIADMRKRAKQVDEFMLQQLTEKGKQPPAI